jgi:oxygen-independent coproporphyrinogen-3 oxidase
VRELILSLKLGGIQSAPFKAKYGVDVLAEFEPVWRRLEKQGMSRGVRGGIELTREGLLRADLLLPEFYAPEYRHARYT